MLQLINLVVRMAKLFFVICFIYFLIFPLKTLKEFSFSVSIFEEELSSSNNFQNFMCYNTFYYSKCIESSYVNINNTKPSLNISTAPNLSRFSGSDHKDHRNMSCAQGYSIFSYLFISLIHSVYESNPGSLLTFHLNSGLRHSDDAPQVFISTLNLNSSDSFKAFCKHIHLELADNFKITRTFILPNLVNIPPTSFYYKSNQFGWMDGCSSFNFCALRVLSILFIKVIRLCMCSSSRYSDAVYLLGLPGLTKRKRVRVMHHIRFWKPSHCHLVYLYLFLLLSGDIHPNPGPIFPPHHRHPRAKSLIVGAWNVRTLLEKKRSHIRPTAVVGRLLNEYKIDICALSETRVHGEHKVCEAGAGYTFFLNGRSPDNPPQIHGVGFAIRSELVAELNGKLPTAINERLMTLSLPVQGGTLHIVSAYAPTMAQSHVVKEQFYHELSQVLDKIPLSDKVLLLGDFNARVGTDHEGWEGVLGKHGVGNENSNGTALLSLCSQRDLVITNTLFHQDERFKTTWMHPGTKKWHLIDYAITRKRDVKDVLHTKAMCGSLICSDHKLIKCKLAVQSRKTVRHNARNPLRKLNIKRLFIRGTSLLLAENFAKAFDKTEVLAETSDKTLANFQKITRQVSENVLGFSERKHRDWFDENNQLIQPLLKELHDLKCQLLENKNNSELRDVYRDTKKSVETQLHDMQNSWWIARAEEIQTAADKRDFKAFWQGLKAVYGPRYQSYPSVKSKDGKSLITDPKGILYRWVEHFDSVLNQPSNFDMSVLDKLPQWEVNPELAVPPSLKEIRDSIKQMTAGKAAGADGIPPDIYKHGGPTVPEQLLKLFSQSWKEGRVPQAFKDADLIHLYKNKGDIKCCDNHRGISLLCIAGKIYARILLNRLIRHIKSIRLIPESQCGFEAGRSTIDPCFALRQLQEKCWFHSRDLYLLFIDLTKAFDTVNRDGLWALLKRIGCPDEFVSVIQSFHDGMKVTVREGSEKAEPFIVTSGTKQGCVLAPTLFSIFFSLMLFIAFENVKEGVEIHSRFDRGLLSTHNVHYKAPTKVESTVIRDLLFADDCALAASSHEDLQRLCDSFANAASKFGLKISIDKTKSMYQPPPRMAYQAPDIHVEGNKLKAVKTFKYLGSIVSDNNSMDAEIDARLVRANSAYNKLTKRLWRKSGIRLMTKIAVYKAAVLSSLLYGSEAWTLPRRLIRKLEKFHLSSLRKIAGIRWYHKVPNFQVLEKCKVMSINSMLDQNKLRWVGHVTRMDDFRIPKRMLYGRLARGSSHRGNHLTYINSVRKTLKACDLYDLPLEAKTCNRNDWRRSVKAGIFKADEDYRTLLAERYIRNRAKT